MHLQQLSDLVDIAKSRPIRKLVIAAAADEYVLDSVKKATEEGFVIPIMVGDKDKIEAICKTLNFDVTSFEIIHEPDEIQAAVIAVQLITDGKADILMKGLLRTGDLMKIVLDKNEKLTYGRVLSHIALFETPFYHKLLGVTDAALNVSPNFDQKVQILKNAVDMFHKIGIESPKVAVLTPVETINPKIESTIHAAMLSAMNKRGQITGCIVDGPLAMDLAISNDATTHKEFKSDVAGDSDILLAPGLNSGNILYKSLTFFGAIAAGVVVGARVPIVLTSRSDSEKSKYMSIALAAAME